MEQTRKTIQDAVRESSMEQDTVRVPRPADGEAIILISDSDTGAHALTRVRIQDLPPDPQLVLYRALYEAPLAERIAGAVAEATANPGHAVEVKTS